MVGLISKNIAQMISTSQNYEPKLPHHLQRALDEHLLRQQETIESITYIFDLCKAKLQHADPEALQDSMLKIIQQDQQIQRVFDLNFTTSEQSYALKSNKNIKLFEDSIELLQYDNTVIDAIITGDYENHCPLLVGSKTLFPNHKAFTSSTYLMNRFGSSKINQLHYLATTALRASGYEEELRKEYNTSKDMLETNPYKAILQGVKFKISENTIDLYHQQLEDWFYIQQNKDNTQELLVPTLGYAFGGSRSDSKYKKLPLYNEDCSSSLTKWLGLGHDRYATRDFVLFYKNYNKVEQRTLTPDLFTCLSPKPETSLPEIGDIILTRSFSKGKVTSSHIGIVTDYSDNMQCCEYLSYNRDLYRDKSYNNEKGLFGFEGLGYSTQAYIKPRIDSSIALDEVELKAEEDGVVQMFFTVL